MNVQAHNATLHTAYEQAFKENAALKEVLAELAKTARGTIAKHGMWNQEFDGNEIVAAIALFDATKGVLSQKENALSIGIQFIGMLEDHNVYGETAVEVLERMNQALIFKSIAESQDRQEQAKPSGIIL